MANEKRRAGKEINGGQMKTDDGKRIKEKKTEKGEERKRITKRKK